MPARRPWWCDRISDVKALTPPPHCRLPSRLETLIFRHLLAKLWLFFGMRCERLLDLSLLQCVTKWSFSSRCAMKNFLVLRRFSKTIFLRRTMKVLSGTIPHAGVYELWASISGKKVFFSQLWCNKTPARRFSTSFSKFQYCIINLTAHDNSTSLVLIRIAWWVFVCWLQAVFAEVGFIGYFFSGK